MCAHDFFRGLMRTRRTFTSSMPAPRRACACYKSERFSFELLIDLFFFGRLRYAVPIAVGHHAKMETHRRPSHAADLRAVPPRGCPTGVRATTQWLDRIATDLPMSLAMAAEGQRSDSGPCILLMLVEPFILSASDSESGDSRVFVQLCLRARARRRPGMFRR